MLTAALVLLGTALVVLALVDRPVRRLPLSPALIYLALGWLAGTMLAGPDAAPALVVQHAGALRVMVEIAVLTSLLAIGLRLRLRPTWAEWHVALWLAGPGMLLTIAMAAVAAVWLFAMPWPVALLLAAVLSPTDPVLASEVQIRHDADRDAARMALTAEGALNDASASPVVALALGLLGLHLTGHSGAGWWLHWAWADLLLPLVGGAVLGMGLGWLLGRSLHARVATGDPLARDELLYVGAVALSFGLAHAFGLSTFMVALGVGVTLLLPLRGAGTEADADRALAERLYAFGSRLERLVEASTVLAVGALLSGLKVGWLDVAYALLLAFVVRPLAVMAIIRKRTMPPAQRRLVAWFGIRGLGSLFYLLLALEFGAGAGISGDLIRLTLVCIAVSIILHGVSATPLMAAYQRRRERSRRPPPRPPGSPGAPETTTKPSSAPPSVPSPAPPSSPSSAPPE